MNECATLKWGKKRKKVRQEENQPVTGSFLTSSLFLISAPFSSQLSFLQKMDQRLFTVIIYQPTLTFTPPLLAFRKIIIWHSFWHYLILYSFFCLARCLWNISVKWSHTVCLCVRRVPEPNVRWRERERGRPKRRGLEGNTLKLKKKKKTGLK